MNNRMNFLITSVLIPLMLTSLASAQDFIYGSDLTVGTLYVYATADENGDLTLVPLAADFVVDGGFRDEDIIAFRAANTSNAWKQVGFERGAVLAISGRDEDLLRYDAVQSMFGSGGEIGLGSSTEDIWGLFLSGGAVEIDPWSFLDAYYPGGGNDVLVGGRDEDLIYFIDGHGCALSCGGDSSESKKVVVVDAKRGPPDSNQGDGR